MPNIQIPQITLALTANGGATGILQVSDTTDIYPGAIVYLSDTAATAQLELLVLEIIDATHFRARLNTNVSSTGKSYVRGSNFSAFTVAHQSYIAQNAQLCPVESNMAKKIFVP